MKDTSGSENLKERLLDRTFRKLKEGVILLDEAHSVVYVNPAAEKYTGIKESKLLCLPVDEIIEVPAEGCNLSFSSVIKSVIKTGSETEGVASVRGKDDIFIQFSLTPFWENDIYSGASVTFTEKRDSVKANNKKNKQKYKGLFDNALEGIIILDSSSGILEANQTASEIYEIEKKELEKLKAGDLFPHKSKQEVEMLWSEFLRTGYLNGFYKYQVSNGTYRYIEFRSRTDFVPGLHLGVFTDVTEKVLTEKALRQSEANLKAIFNSGSQRIILIDNAGKIITFNDAAQDAATELGNVKLEVGEYLYNVGNKNDRRLYLELLEEARSGSSVIQEIQPYEHLPDYWLEISLIPIIDEHGQITSICFTATDISLRKSAELSLKEREARFRSLVQNSSDIITILSPDGRITYVSSSISKIMGYTEKSIFGNDIYEFLHEEDHEDFRKALEESFKFPGEVEKVEYRFLHSEGFYIHLETTINNLVEDEYIEGIVLNSRDVTERRFQEESLLLLERAIDSSKNGIIITDPNQPDNPIIYANKAFERITGYTYLDIIGKNCRILQNNDRNQPELNKIRKALSKKQGVSVRLRNYKKNGSLFWNDLNISPVFNSGGELTNYIGVLNDITERQIAEETLLDITHGVSSERKNFYETLALYLSSSLSLDYVFIGEIDNLEINTKAYVKRGSIEESFQQQIPILPPDLDLIRKRSTVVTQNARKEFPENSFFRQEGITSYLGVPLNDYSGRCIGVISVMGVEPIANPDLVESLLSIFALRIAAELEREKYVTTLKESEEKFRSLAENSPDIIYILNNLQGKVIYFNRSKILGYSKKQLEASEFWSEIVHPDDKEVVVSHWKKFLASNEHTDSIEYRVKKDNGEYEWIVNRHSILTRNEGEPEEILLTLTVITERKRAEEGLRESENRLSALVENTNDLIWSVDAELKFTTINSAFKKFCKKRFGKKVKIGLSLEHAIPPDLQESWVENHTRALKGKSFSTEIIISDKFFEISFNPILSENMQVTGVSVFARDISERKKAENDIIRTNFELDSFVYRASHDLRAPLRSVLGLVNLVKNEGAEEQRRYYLQLVNKSINKLDTFITDLTNFSRNSRLEVTPEEINFRELLSDTIENLQYMENAGKVKIYKRISCKEPFYSDQTRISIIFHNLISNSIKYYNPLADVPQCKVTVNCDKKMAMIKISDNGKGIRKEFHTKIFDMFFRASQESYGSGLGLYITRQVVEKLGGTISLESEPGQGTEFRIRIPGLKN